MKKDFVGKVDVQKQKIRVMILEGECGGIRSKIAGE